MITLQSPMVRAKAFSVFVVHLALAGAVLPEQFAEDEQRNLQKLQLAQSVVDATTQSFQKKLADINAETEYLKSLLVGK